MSQDEVPNTSTASAARPASAAPASSPASAAPASATPASSPASARPASDAVVQPVPLDRSVGYVLKQAATALHNAMEAVLRPCGLTLAQYSCLEQLAQTPGLTNAQLARGTFVSPQSMNDVLRGLSERGLVDRADRAPRGRALPTYLTVRGSEHLDQARAVLVPVQAALDAAAVAAGEERLLDGLRAIIDALEAPSQA